MKASEPYSLSRSVEHLWSLQRNSRKCLLSCQFQWKFFSPCNPRIDHYSLSELVEDQNRSLMGGDGTCWDAAGFKLITSRPAVQIQSLLKAEVIKEHVLMESLGNICGEKWLWEGNAHMYACVCARTHTHTHTHTPYLKCTRQSADSYLTRVSLYQRLLESKNWGFWLLNSQNCWVNYWMACWTQKDSGWYVHVAMSFHSHPRLPKVCQAGLTPSCSALGLFSFHSFSAWNAFPPYLQCSPLPFEAYQNPSYSLLSVSNVFWKSFSKQMGAGHVLGNQKDLGLNSALPLLSSWMSYLSSLCLCFLHMGFGEDLML